MSAVRGDTRVWPGRLARAGSGLVVLAVVGLVVAAPRPTRVEPAGPVEASLVQVAPPRATLVCAGPLILPSAAGTGDAAFDPVPVPPVESVDVLTTDTGATSGAVAAPVGVTPLGAGAPSTTITPVGAGGTGGVAGPASALVLTADPVGTSPARVAGATASVVTAGDLRGLAAASCQRPASDLWLVGGSTEISSSAQLVVDNPGTTVSEVSVTVWGPTGPVELASGAGALVPAGGEKVISLPGVAAEQRQIALHVVASGGNVTATVQDSQLRGFTPAGTERVVPGQPPATRQVVAGIVVTASTADDPDAALLRVLAPGSAGTTATITLLGPDGPVALPGAATVELGAGEVTDVPLGGLPAGAYTAVVDAPVPVVAAAMVTRPGLPGALDDGPTLERAWAASGPSGAGGLATVPRGTTATVVVGALAAGADPSDGASAAGVLRALGPDGQVLAERQVDLAAGSTLAVPVAGLGAGVTGVELVPSAGSPLAANPVTLAWGLLATVERPDGELLSVLVPTPDAARAPAVPVRQAGRLGLS